jgi:hypothetical protein
MDSIADLMQQKKPNEPPQLRALREYVKTNHGADIKTAISQFGYTITVPNAPLASTLRMETPKIRIACNLDKKLFIRIGS